MNVVNVHGHVLRIKLWIKFFLNIYKLLKMVYTVICLYHSIYQETKTVPEQNNMHNRLMYNQNNGPLHMTSNHGT